MTLSFQMRREDVLEFSRAYHATSPTYQRTRTRARWALPILMVVVWTILTLETGFEVFRTVFYALFSLAWFIFYPKRFDQRVQKYAERTLSEPGHSKSLGPCTLTLSDEGLSSTSQMGTSSFAWDAVSRSSLSDTYLIIFLSGPLGYPIQIADIGRASAEQAHAFVQQHIRHD